MNDLGELSVDWIAWLGGLPWLALGLLLIPLVWLAWKRRVYPTRLAGILFLIPTLTSFLVVWNFEMFLAVMLVDVVLIIVILGDLIALPSIKSISVTRQTPRAASLAGNHPVELMVDNPKNSQIQLYIRDDLPDGFSAEPAEHLVVVPPLKRVTVQHVLQPHRRGEFKLQWVYLKTVSPLRLWQQYHKDRCESTLHVYPDMNQMSKYAILARTNRLALIGVRRTRKAGQDNNFERLRDYTLDDNYKHIDWRSTARRQKLTVKQFQTDQSQRVIFMLDCGRMMTNLHDGYSLVDYALNAILMLSYVALRQGDSVGLLCFSDRIHTYVPPAGGSRQVNRILQASFDRFPTLVESRFDQAFLHLSANCRRRSMVVLLTNVIDEVGSTQISGYLQNLVGRHLPLLVMLRDHRIFDAADLPSADPAVMYRSAAAASILNWRYQVLRRMQQSGVLVLDAFPEQMTSPLVNQYLEIKARHML